MYLLPGVVRSKQSSCLLWDTFITCVYALLRDLLITVEITCSPFLFLKEAHKTSVGFWLFQFVWHHLKRKKCLANIIAHGLCSVYSPCLIWRTHLVVPQPPLQHYSLNGLSMLVSWRGYFWQVHHTARRIWFFPQQERVTHLVKDPIMNYLT